MQALPSGCAGLRPACQAHDAKVHEGAGARHLVALEASAWLS